MAGVRSPNVQDRNQSHVRAPHERDYEREERYQKNPQGGLSKGSTPAKPSPALNRPKARGTSGRGGR